MPLERINIDKPRYDQSNFFGRARHFFTTVNPMNAFKSTDELMESKRIVEAYKAGDNMPELSEDKLWYYKNIYDSAFHPDSKKLMFLPGRMSFQVPANIVITGCLMSFYKSKPAIIFWQWFNQTFNALVNYTNCSGDNPISKERLGISYTLATGGALTTALYINKQVSRFPPIAARLVPLVAVIAANCINIPCMRSNELFHGVSLIDEDGNRVGESRKAAAIGISQVVLSRVMMAAPSMLIPAFVMDRLEKRGVLQRIKGFSVPLQLALVGAVLIFSTPLGCAIFPQVKSIEYQRLEPNVQEAIRKKLDREPRILFYNKGL